MYKIVIVLVFVVTQIQAQKRYEIDKGKIDFTSNAAIELIAGSDEKVQGLVDPAKNTFAFIVNMKEFSGFNSALQKEHFNEKYLETDKFYQATFSGSFIDPVNYEKEGIYRVKAKGFLTIHGVKQLRTISGTITIEKGKMVIDADFVVPLADHGIKIPEIVSQKIATEIIVKLKFYMKEKAGKGTS